MIGLQANQVGRENIQPGYVGQGRGQGWVQDLQVPR